MPFTFRYLWYLSIWFYLYACNSCFLQVGFLQNRMWLEIQNVNNHFTADARSRKILGNPDANTLLKRVAAKGQSNYQHIRSGLRYNGGAVEKSCNISASHFAFPDQYNSSITYFLKIAIFQENERAEKKKIWLQKEAAYGQYSNWWKNQSPRARQVRRTVSHKSLSCSPGFSNHDVAMVWGRFMGWEGDSVQAVACY